MLTLCKWLANDPLHHSLSQQGCPTQSMVVKYNAGIGCKKGAFQADLAVIWPKKEVFEPTIWVQNPLDSDKMCLFII